MSLYDEGHTIAGWTGCAIATVGSGVVGAGLCTGSVPALVGGAVVVAASVLVTWVLHLNGWGKPPGVRPREEWRLGARDTQARGGHPGCVGCALAGRRPASAPVAARAESIPLSSIE
ncbi:HGxxPAAW family protein [Streptomyces sp. NPDC090023]|uniref:HGxxPAAW family protein n=1 Tax=unclassified Streptomyces TaxID=2593676 RepID=UPI0037FE31A6